VTKSVYLIRVKSSNVEMAADGFHKGTYVRLPNPDPEACETAYGGSFHPGVTVFMTLGEAELACARYGQGLVIRFEICRFQLAEVLKAPKFEPQEESGQDVTPDEFDEVMVRIFGRRS